MYSSHCQHMQLGIFACFAMVYMCIPIDICHIFAILWKELWATEKWSWSVRLLFLSNGAAAVFCYIAIIIPCRSNITCFYLHCVSCFCVWSLPWGLLWWPLHDAMWVPQRELLVSREGWLCVSTRIYRYGSYNCKRSQIWDSSLFILLRSYNGQLTM